jgi:transposase-like protein
MIECPLCQSDNITSWIVEDKSYIFTDSQGNDWITLVKGNKCNDCNKIWYEHYKGLASNFYWTEKEGE